ncbi:MAG: MATE family efflux transporter [Pseudomonadales bacterium]|nr:MATE family efflux transporter [Pseudomonadales bacterium]
MLFPPAERTSRILSIGIPIMGAMISNVLLGLVDTAMVGQLGDAALGAVGLSSFASNIYLGLLQGFSIAVQATVSRRRGQNRLDECGLYLRGALVAIAIFGPASALLLYFAIPVIFPLINPDPLVVSTGIDYIRWLILQSTFVGFIAANTGFWNGLGRPRVYLPTMVTMHITNVLLNYVFIFGRFGMPEMGAEGAGFATFLASLAGAVMFLRLGLKHGQPYGYKGGIPGLTEVRNVARLAVPAGMQQLLDTLALTTTYSIVGIIGTRELACYSVLINFINLVGLPAWGLGAAGATLVGHALGERDAVGASRWAWDTIRLGVSAMAILGVPFWLFPDPLLSLWITDPETRELAIIPTRILGVMIMFNGVGYMLANMLNGAGDVKRVTWINFATQWFILVPGAWLIGPELGYGLIGVWSLHQFGYRAGPSLIFSWFWRQGAWARVNV